VNDGDASAPTISRLKRVELGTDDKLLPANVRRENRIMAVRQNL
jgi:hypothetical protein